MPYYRSIGLSADSISKSANMRNILENWTRLNSTNASSSRNKNYDFEILQLENNLNKTNLYEALGINWHVSNYLVKGT